MDRLVEALRSAFALAVLAVAAVVLLAMGRVPICTCGYVKPWHGIVASAENSQHLSDWYTFSHIIHGFAFYLLFWPIGRRFGLAARSSPRARGAARVGMGDLREHAADHQSLSRSTTIALDYYGDSVLNSLADIAAMVAGFLLAMRLPVWLSSWRSRSRWSCSWCYWIRDNLALNIIQLLHPFESILRWQRGG